VCTGANTNRKVAREFHQTASGLINSYITQGVRNADHLVRCLASTDVTEDIIRSRDRATQFDGAVRAQAACLSGIADFDGFQGIGSTVGVAIEGDAAREGIGGIAESENAVAAAIATDSDYRARAICDQTVKGDALSCVTSAGREGEGFVTRAGDGGV
jgi:hypothetical protein